MIKAMPKHDPVAALFEKKLPVVRKIYDRLAAAISKIGPFEIEPKKTSIHLVRGTAFAGVHPKKSWLDVTIRTEFPLKSPRVRAQEQVSKNRWHQDVRLTALTEIDSELKRWLRAAYDLAD